MAPPDATSALMAGGQPSEVVVARIAALRASICRDMFAGSIKLSFKPALTDKGQVSIGLDLLINGPVLPSVAKGNRVSLGELHKKTVYRFGPFQLDSGRATLTRNGKQLKLQDLPFRMLAILVEKAGEIVSREELRQRLWPENTFVEFDNSLGVAIRKIRDALGDNADSPCYVETVPRQGYRFLAPVTTVTESEVPVRPLAPRDDNSVDFVAPTRKTLCHFRPGVALHSNCCIPRACDRQCHLSIPPCADQDRK